MRKLSVLALCVAMIPALNNAADDIAAAAKPETIHLLKCFDHGKVMTYKIATQSELKTLMDELASESKFWDKAMSASEKAWKADSSTAKKSFPKNAISPRKIVKLEQFTDQEKASNRLNALEKAQAENDEADRKRADDEKKRRNATATRILGERANRTKDDKGGADREALLESARSLFESKLQELSGGAAGGAPAAPAAAEPEKDKEKKDAKH